MKKLLPFLLLCSLTFSVLAEHVGEKQAADVAKVMLPTQQLKDISDAKIFKNLYIFSDDNSFVIVSADDSYRPIVAYSYESPFVIENMPDNIKYWLGSMNEEIQYAIDNKVSAPDDVKSEWADFRRGEQPAPKTRTSVLPLLHTKWDQGEPFNNMCPATTSGQGHCPVGCAATAMAQIMKYWEWPRQGAGSHSYSAGGYGTQSVNFGNTIYDWDNMIDYPTSSSPMEQQNAVAELSYHCGVSIDMGYGDDGSSAVPNKVVSALKTYFDYSNSISSIRKNNYNYDTWISLLKTEINAGRPIHYSGWDTGGGGHSFVCDGYDESDNFHFNWGWGGYCDGYFAIGYLSPGQGGIGSGSGCYNENNLILVGIRPNDAAINAPSNLSASVNGRNVSLTWDAVSGADHYKVYRNGFVIDDNVSGTSFTDSDLAYGTYDYYVRSVKSDGSYSHASSSVSATVTFDGPVPTNLDASVSGNTVELSWDAPENESAVLKYADSDNSLSAMGLNTPTMYWGQRYTTEQLAQYAGMAIQSVEIFHRYVYEYTLHIYSEVDGALVEVVTKTYNTTKELSWFTVTLPTLLPIDYTHNLIVATHCDEKAYPAVCTDYDGNANAALYGVGSSFSQADGVSWLMRTNITDGTFTYNISKDGVKIAENHSGSSYSYNESENGFHEYHVTTNYFGNESQPSNSVCVPAGATKQFLGNNSTQWTAADNWKNNSMPSSTDNVWVRNDVIVDANADINSMYINKGVTATVNAGKTLNVSDDIESLSENEWLTVESGGAFVSGAAGVKGTVKRQFAVDSKDRVAGKWHFLSSPVAAAPVSDFINSADGQNYDLYVYDEPSFTWLNEKDDNHDVDNLFYTENGMNFKPGRGYLASFGSDATMSFVGVLNTGEVTIPVTASSSSNLKGFNLVGNPYPCSIDWDAENGWTRNVLGDNPYIWIYNDDVHQYGAYQLGNGGSGTNGVTNVIASCQGFFVKAVENGDLIINDDVKTTESGAFRKGNDPKSISIKVSGKNGSDEVMICKTDKKLNNAEKLYSKRDDVPSLYLKADGEKYSIVNVNDDENILIPMGFECGVTGKFTISSNSDVELIDKLTGNVIDLSSNSYEFVGSMADDYDRFMVRIQNDSDDDEFVYQNGDELIVKGNGQVRIFDCLGRVVVDEFVTNGKINVSALNTGVYVVRMENMNQKIVIK
ncbi:MAG: C10 family peptidase [Bacteroidia bacterium]|nr:C10 family peptidase [Bacteroidia bacterium]